jgi:hypothetical protein
LEKLKITQNPEDWGAIYEKNSSEGIISGIINIELKLQQEGFWSEWKTAFQKWGA